MSKISLICEYCGKKFEREKGEHNRNIKLGRKVFCSLSCTAKQNHIDRPSKGNPEFLANYKYQKDEYSSFRWFLKVINNKNRNKGVFVTLEYLKELWDKQKGVCPYTGWNLILPDSTKGWKNKNNKSYRASLDRIDNSKGYSKGNVQYVSFMANIAKNNMSDNEMFKFCEAVVNNIMN